MSELGLRAVSGAGFFAMIGIAWLLSSDRRRFPWRTVASGVALQGALGALLLLTPWGSAMFVGINAGVARFLAYTNAGVAMVFGPLAEVGFSFLANVLPILIFMGAVFSVLYHLGIVQRVVDALAAVLSRTMDLSGAESLSAVANVFIGMAESALVVRPYLDAMTRSELFSLMTVGMGTIAGSVLLAYVGILGGGDFAGHLVTASLLSAPAGLVIAKVMEPETGTPATSAGAHSTVEREAVNTIDAAATGAINGMRLAAYVGAMLIAFRAGIELANDLLGTAGGWVGVEGLRLELLLGFAMAPFALLMGVEPGDAIAVGGLLGVKTVLNEFLAYQGLGEAIAAGSLSPRSIRIASYALCGFANFGSLAILLGGIGGMAPQRRGDVAALGMRSIVGGSLTTFMTACVAGALT
ncbi:MAG: nucleoside transporter C-terminal domain-containing protein [Myxococcota bacterium]|nr:NupC/NupG family nucleoside CNT transporter [Myxococcales bacterium]